MTDAEIMMSLFEGSDVAYGSTELTGKTNPTTGKQEARYIVIRKPVTLALWELHLKGHTGLGILPINTRNNVRFAAIDVDVYQGIDLRAINQKIQEAKIPMVLCRSKSGGPHLYMFFREPIPARLVVEKLDAIAGFMGFGKAEIFPKQTSIEGNDVGNFINMPYFGGTKFLRYGHDAAGNALTDIPSFAKYAYEIALTREQLEAYEPPTQSGPLPDGPPCLNRILEMRTGEFRNITLSNIAVYCKKAFPEDWAKKVDEYNHRFSEPLPSKEVEAIIKSHEKKNYRYQCSVSPLSTYCNSSACRRAKFGIGRATLMPVQRSLTKVNTIPPMWYVDVVMTKDDKDEIRRMSLTTEELQNPRLYQRRCMEVIQTMPELMKADDWQKEVSILMKHCSVIDVPAELSPEGQFKEMVEDFLTNRASVESWDDLLRGLPYKDEQGYHFRPKDLWKYVANQRFSLIPQNQQMAVLKQDMKAMPGVCKIKGTSTRYLTIQLTAQEPEPLDVPKTDTAF